MYKIDQLTEIDLGVVQENEATEIQIDVSPWLKKWPDGIFTVNVCRPGEMEPYPANCRVENGMLYWLVTEGELAIAGNGRCDIRLYQGTVKKKTRIAITRIHETLPGSTQEAPPNAAQGWLDSLNETRAEVESNTKAAKESAAQAAASEEQAQGHAQSAAESANAAKTAKQHAEQAAESAQQHAESAAQDAQFLSQRSAVWVGTQAPPEPGYDLWVNPEGRETELPGGTYELPTASADVKGGVKVGPGLQMDGDVLGVKEDTWELIETITLEEDTAAIVRNVKLSGVMVLAKFAKASKTTNSILRATINSYTKLTGNAFLRADGETSARFSVVKKGAFWDLSSSGYVFGWGSGQYYGQGNASEVVFVKDNPTIDAIRLYAVDGAGVIPSGSVIEIWGVRADA